MLSGKKTYIVAAIGVLTAIGGYLTGDLEMAAAIAGVLAALGLGTLRSGVKKAEPKA